MVAWIRKALTHVERAQHVAQYNPVGHRANDRNATFPTETRSVQSYSEAP